jgi:hypothetical protein
VLDDPPCRLDPVQLRHPDVHHDHVGVQLRCLGYGLQAVGCLAQLAGCPGSRLAVVNRDQFPLSASRARDYCQVMIKREIVLPPGHLFPPEEWRVMEARYSD